MGNFGRITRVKDLPSAAKFEAYVKKAVLLIDHVNPIGRKYVSPRATRFRLTNERCTLRPGSHL